MTRQGSLLSVSALAGAFLFVALAPGAAHAKPPKEGDVYHYYANDGTCLEDTWESSDEGTGFEPAGGWGPCPIAKPHERSHAVKKPKRASPN